MATTKADSTTSADDADAPDLGSVPAEPAALSLAAEFATPSRADWAGLVDQVVRRSGRIKPYAEAGAGVATLTWSTPDGIRVSPLYTADDPTGREIGVPGAPPFVRGSRAGGVLPDGWDVRQRHAELDAEAARVAIAADLENGVNSIWLTVGEGGTAISDLAAVLAAVYLDLAPVVLDAGADAEPAADAFLALAADRAVPATELLGTLGLDPLGLRARTGGGPDTDSIVPLARRVAAQYPQVKAVVVDALPVHSAGGTDGQELGWSLAVGVAYLRALTSRPDDTASYEDTADRKSESRQDTGDRSSESRQDSAGRGLASFEENAGRDIGSREDAAGHESQSREENAARESGVTAGDEADPGGRDLSTAEGLDLCTAARLIEFRYAATAEQFPTIAKLRAARRLWARVTEACGAAQPQHQHAVTSPLMQTRRDPYVNLLRGTVAGFAAGLGGADAVTVAPFDAALGASVPFSRRIARNTQSLLIEESHLARVIDPAGGSWFVEHLTDELARAGWAFFQEIEAAGGARAALDSGLLAQHTAAARERRLGDVATRRTPILGVSEFADLTEKPVERTPLPTQPGERTATPRQPKERHSRPIGLDERAVRSGVGGGGGLPVFRLAERYEAYRDRSDAQLAETGARPRAFLATLGSLAAYTARAGFARNLLAAGGIETVDAGPTESPAEVVKAFADAGTPVVVLCSTDKLYAERAETTVLALREAGARHILLAGRADVADLDGQLYTGGDALAVIDAVYQALEGSQ